MPDPWLYPLLRSHSHKAIVSRSSSVSAITRIPGHGAGGQVQTRWVVGSGYVISPWNRSCFQRVFHMNSETEVKSVDTELMTDGSFAGNGRIQSRIIRIPIGEWDSAPEPIPVAIRVISGVPAGIHIHKVEIET